MCPSFLTLNPCLTSYIHYDVFATRSLLQVQGTAHPSAGHPAVTKVHQNLCGLDLYRPEWLEVPCVRCQSRKNGNAVFKHLSHAWSVKPEWLGHLGKQYISGIVLTIQSKLGSKQHFQERGWPHTMPKKGRGKELLAHTGHQLRHWMPNFHLANPTSQ